MQSASLRAGGGLSDGYVAGEHLQAPDVRREAAAFVLATPIRGRTHRGLVAGSQRGAAHCTLGPLDLVWQLTQRAGLRAGFSRQAT